MNGKELYSAPVALKDYGVEQTYYMDDDENIKFAETEKGVKLFCYSEKYPTKRINFWFPKSFLVKSEDHYAHVKFGGIDRLKECKRVAIEQQLNKWDLEDRWGDKTQIKRSAS